jgi:prepilin signal peptidase PulO-like enzyme (type II secretory pathway)
MWLLLVGLFLAGLGGGVLLNSLADNLPPDANDERHPPRRPACRQCGRPYALAHWLALAHLARGGRCARCGAPRSAAWRAAAVELAAGFSAAGLWLWAISPGGPLPAALLRYAAALVLVWSCILITVIDVEHRLILWNVVWPVALATALFGLALPGKGLTKTLWGGLAGYGITLGIFLLAEVYARVVQRLRGQPLEEVAFGGGDVNLAGIVGLAVGWPGVILALTLAVLAGGLYGLVYIAVQLVRRRYAPHSAMPYGPFLVMGALVIYLFGRDLQALAAR